MDDLETPPRRCALVVEDDPSSRRALIMLLRGWGWETIGAETVGEAMRELRCEPDCLILDLMLPDGNGASVLKHVRESGLPIRVAVATGTSDPAMLAEVAALRPDVLYRKPLDAMALAQWLGEQRE